jgi:hypothetical protein
VAPSSSATASASLGRECFGVAVDGAHHREGLARVGLEDDARRRGWALGLGAACRGARASGLRRVGVFFFTAGARGIGEDEVREGAVHHQAQALEVSLLLGPGFEHAV